MKAVQGVATRCMKRQPHPPAHMVSTLHVNREWNAMNNTHLASELPAGTLLRGDRLLDSIAVRNGSIRILRLPQVKNVTGLGKTKIYELQGEGDFPMRVKITVRSVGWIEDEVQAWLAKRAQTSTPLQIT